MDNPSSSAQRILAVDDDADILSVVQVSLEIEGFDVALANSALAAREWISRNGLPHLAIIDIMMPEIDGLELSRSLHTFCDLPIILLTSIDEEETVVKAIDEIAEDYVTKPFQPRVLAARTKRLLRRLGDFSYTLDRQTVIDERLAIDFAHQQAEVDKREISLTPKETKLLHILIRNAHRTVTTDYLLRRLWPLEEIFEDALRVHIHRLRHKIEPDPSSPRYLVTQRGTGYSFLPTA